MSEHGDPSKGPIEITVRAVVLGMLLSVVLGAANVYLGLKAGMTVAASIPAAVVSMGVLRLFKGGGIHENNIVQTAASAGESLAAGVIFTIPALVLMGVWTEFNYWETTIIAALGGMIGVAFTIPLRRALIVGSELKFPEGVATAEVLRVGESGEERGAGLRNLLVGSGLGGLFKLCEAGFKLFAGIAEGATRIGSSVGYFGVNLSPALVAVGYIVGLNIAVLVFAGGALNWYGAIPAVVASQDWPVYELESADAPEPAWNTFRLKLATPKEGATKDKRAAVEKQNAEIRGKIGKPVDPVEYSGRVWSKRTRYIGVGAMVVGGLWALVRLWGKLVAGIAGSIASARAARAGSMSDLPREERDTPITWVAAGLVACVVPLFFVFEYATGVAWIAAVMAVLMLVAGFLFSAVAAYMAGLVGSSNNPISGVTIATLLTVSLLLLALGMTSDKGPEAALLIGAVVCCAAAIGGDNMQDLKTGHIIGATPWKQQIMQSVGVLTAAFVMAPVLTLLLRAYGIGSITVEGQTALAAPQASLMMSVAKGVFARDLPWIMVGIGAAVAVGIIVLDVVLERRGAVFRTPVLAVAVGLYLPLELGSAIFAGGLVAWAAHRWHMSRIADEASGELQSSMAEAKKSSERGGLLLAAGLITGEAIVGILLAIPIVINEGKNPLDVGLGHTPMWPGLILLAAVIAWLYRAATRSAAAAD